MRTIAIVLVAVLAAACGDDDGAAAPDAALGSPDAASPDSGEADAAAPDGGEMDGGADAASPGGPLAGIGEVELIDEGYMFTEGPQWIEADGVLLFSDIPANTIYRLDPEAGDAIDVFRADSGMSNGLGVDGMGRLLAAEHGNRRISRTEADGEIVAVCEEYMLMRFNSPNDVIARSDGTLYFTDPPYGLARPMDRELPFNGLFRADPMDRCHVEQMGSLDARPNGVVLSPDESILYVADTEACVVHAYDVATDGTLSGMRDFATDTCGADGMAIDTAGNLWVTTGDGIDVFAPDGMPWGTVMVPRVAANAAFGEADRRTLYVTAREGIYRVRVTIPGIY